MWQVIVRSSIGWIVHSIWSTRRDAKDQADYVQGKVVKV